MRPALLLVAALASSGGCAGVLASPERPELGPDWDLVPHVRLVSARSTEDCGAAALQMVLGRWQPELAADAVTRELRAPDAPGGYRAGRLRDLALRHGLQAFVLAAGVGDLVHEVQLGRPVIVGVVVEAGGKAVTHYQVIAGVNQSAARVLVADPRGRWRVLGFDDLTTEWRPTGQLALVVLPSHRTRMARRL